MRQSYDERHWYGRMGWPDLRSSISRIAADAFAKAEVDEDLTSVEPILFVERLIASIVADIESRREAQYVAQRRGWISAEHSYVATKWDYALTLFAETVPLASALEKDFNILAGRSNRDVGPEQALRETLRQFLEGARRKQSPATEHRQKTWEAISRVSSQVVAEYGPGKVINRCSEEHFAEVQRRLHELYTGKNLTLKDIKTVRSYFYEFCPDCRQQFTPEDDALGAGGSVSQILSEELGEKIRLEHCLSELQRNDPDGWETLIIKSGLDDLPKMSIGDFMTGKGYTRHKFEKLIEKAMEHMRNCFEITTNFRLGRGQ